MSVGRLSLRSSARVAFALATIAATACRSSAEERTAGAGAAGGSANGAVATAAAGTPAGAVPADSTARRAAADSGRILGAPSAKVWMLIASDFQCPYCKLWHDETFETLRKEYVETGKVRMAFLNFPLDMHEQAMPTAEAAMCASAQGKFWEYHTALFNRQSEWAKGGDQTAVYQGIAGQLGLDTTAWRQCMDSHVMRALVEADRDRLARAGVNSTPSFFVAGRPIAGAQPAGAFRQVLDAALAEAAKQPATPATPGAAR